MGLFSSDEWCPYCKGRTDFKCWASGKPEDIPDGYLVWCYDSNVAYAKCELYPQSYIVTGVRETLKLDATDPVITNNTRLVEEVLKKDENYNIFGGAYKKFGNELKFRMQYSLDVKGMVEDTYPRLEKISELIDKGEMDLAACRYIMLTLRLMSTYGFHNAYKNYKANNTNYDQKEFAKEYHEHVKKYTKNS